MAYPAQATRHHGQPTAACADYEIGLLDLADALLRNAPQEYLQQAFAPTLAHIHHCTTCQATLIDLVLTTLRYEAHLPTATAVDPGEVTR